MDRGLLLAVPLDSVLVRVAVAVAVGAFVGHLLYRLKLRSTRARFAAAFIPVVAVLTALGLSLRSPQLPVLMIPTTSGAVLPIPVEYGYLDFAPLAVPLLFGAWLTVAGVLVARRFVRYVTFSRHRTTLTTRAVPSSLHDLVVNTAQRLNIVAPQIIVTEHCRGGAYVAGLRRPCFVVSESLLAQLDTDELHAVVAHELAHISRHDNATAVIVGIIKDMLFFIPGRAWADTSLHRERERAADERAVNLTGKPAALASSMLKAAGLPRMSLAPGVAALAPQGEFVARIEALLTPQPVSRLRHQLELATVALLSGVTVVASIALPAILRTDATDRDGVAVMWSNASTNVKLEQTEARVFAVYREVATPVAVDTPLPVRTHIERQLDNRPSTIRSCTDILCPSQVTAVSLGLVPHRSSLASQSTNVLRATPLNDDPGGSVRMFWVADSH
ncbi:MAG: M56 family metallopeptidase [Nitriliruptoraceae bacterium]